MTSDFVANDTFCVRLESIACVRKSETLQGLTVWLLNGTEVVLVCPSEAERDQTYDWLRSALMEKG